MTDHVISTQKGDGFTALKYSPVFNAAVRLIDGNIEQGRADKSAIVTSDNKHVSYAELDRNVGGWNRALRNLEVEPGARMLMVVKDCPEFFYFFWGAIKAGVIPVPLNTLLRAKDYQYMIEDSQASMVLYSSEYADEVEKALKASTHHPEYSFLADTAATLIGETEASSEVHPSSAEDDCFWLYSSGSTGFPKGTVHRHRDIPETCQLYGVDVLGMQEEDIFFSAAKLFFAYGLGNGMTFPLWVGGTAVLAAERPTPAMTFDIIERLKPTLYFGVPTLYSAQLAALENEQPDLSSIRYCVSAGEALPADIFRRWKERTGTIILDGIGSTEALHIFISNQPDDQKPGTSGRLVPGYEARIVDEEGAVVTPGEAGTLQIRGKSTARIYWNKPEKTAETMLDEDWLSTGDTYRQDEDGYFVYDGRSDDMMKVGGIWTSPVEIEARLIEHPKVLEAAVVGREDDAGLVKPEAWIILANPADSPQDTVRELEAELLAHVKQGLAPYKYPRWWNFVPELPKTATGKIQRYKLRKS